MNRRTTERVATVVAILLGASPLRAAVVTGPDGKPVRVNPGESAPGASKPPASPGATPPPGTPRTPGFPRPARDAGWQARPPARADHDARRGARDGDARDGAGRWRRGGHRLDAADRREGLQHLQEVPGRQADREAESEAGHGARRSDRVDLVDHVQAVPAARNHPGQQQEGHGGRARADHARGGVPAVPGRARVVGIDRRAHGQVRADRRDGEDQDDGRRPVRRRGLRRSEQRRAT